MHFLITPETMYQRTHEFDSDRTDRAELAPTEERVVGSE